MGGVFGSVARAFIGAALTVATGGGFALAMLSFAGSLLLGFISSALAPKPKSPNLMDFTSLSQDRTRQFRQPVTAWRTLYGEARVSGPLTFLGATKNNKRLHMVITLAGHECEGIDTLYVNDDTVSLDYDLGDNNVVNTGKYINLIRCYTHLGVVDGTQPFPALASAVTEWAEDHRQDGHTKVYIEMTYDRNKFPSSIPNLSFWTKGKKVVDSRNASTVAWTPNPALGVRDYLVTPKDLTGFGASTLEVNDTFTNAAANTSEEIVSTARIVVSVLSSRASTDVMTLEGSTTVLFTGDRVLASATDAGVLPAGLAAGTDYFYIPKVRIGELRGKLATTYANALAGTAIDLTDDGTAPFAIIKTGEPRYTMNGLLESDRNHVSKLTDMLSAMGGRAIHATGEWRITAAAYEAPEIDYSEDDFITPLSIKTKVSLKDRFNAVKGIYVSSLNIDQASDYPPVTNAVYQAEDNGERKYLDLDLPMTNRPQTAKRLAKIELERFRQEIVMEGTTTLKGLRSRAGDTVTLTLARMGWSAKVFEVTTWKLALVGDEDSPYLGCEMTFKETASDVFDWNSGLETQVDPAPNTNLPSAFDVTPPSGLTITEETYETRDSSGVKARAIISWTLSPDAFVESYQVQFKLSTESEWTIAPNVDQDATSLKREDVSPGIYDFRLKAINTVGISSDFITKTQEIYGLLAAPTEPQNMTITAQGGLAIIQWDRMTDLDVRVGGYVYIRHSNLLSGAAWIGSVSIGNAIPGSETIAVLPLKGGTYLAKAVDSSGTRSDGFSSVTTKQANVAQFALSSTIQEDTAFTGSTTNIAVNAGAIRLGSSALVDAIADVDSVVDWDVEGGVVNEGTYLWSTVFDFGDVTDKRITTLVSAVVFDAFDQIDDRLGNIDDWETFDGDDTGEADARTFMRQTDDDPTGSPTWGTWERVEVADVSAWGVQLKTVLTTVDNNHNIDVLKLRATAQSAA